MTPLRIAIAGLGTVGAGVVKALQNHRALIEARAGRAVQIVAVSARDPNKSRGFSLEGIAWEPNPLALAVRKDVDLVVELMGGAEGVARDVVTAALSHHKSVVTANKALIATHGLELARLAETHSVALALEAAVAGGIPVLKTLKEALAGNRVLRIAGILNGTCNYILTTMQRERRSFEDVLLEAQKLGYAEADPSTDIDGWDAAHKLAILTSLAFAVPPSLATLRVEGIRDVTLQDMQFAEELGYRIKLLGMCSCVEGRVEQRVHPALVPISSALAQVDSVYNAVAIDAEPVGTLFLQGRGAGEGPTASAVIADLVDVARGRASLPFGVEVSRLVPLESISLSQHQGTYYLRLDVLDTTGVLAHVSDTLREVGISMKSILQKPSHHGQLTSIVGITHSAGEADVQRFTKEIVKHTQIINNARAIRVEE